jgi:hypothetical protein
LQKGGAGGQEERAVKTGEGAALERRRETGSYVSACACAVVVAARVQ